MTRLAATWRDLCGGIPPRGTRGCCAVCGQHGRPLAFYTDKASLFQTTAKA